MNKKLIAVVVILVLWFLYSVIGPLPSGEIISESESKPTITILAGQSSSDAGTEEMIQEVLAKKFPDVDFQWSCVDWGDQFASQVEGKFVSGNLPDILIGKAQDVYPYRTSRIIAPLPEEAYSEISEQSLAVVSSEGAVYGLPYTESLQGVFYNKEIFNRFGLTIPKTIAELNHVVSVLEENNVVAFASHFQESWKIGNMNMQFFMNDIFANDPAWGDRFRAGEVNYSGNPLITSLFKNNQYILEHSFSDAIQINQYESDIRFARGEAAMNLTGTWSLQAMSQMVSEIDVGIFPYPNQSGDARLLVETNMTFMKGNKEENTELVDAVLTEIGTNYLLAREIVDYIQARSTFRRMGENEDIMVQDDAKYYRENNQVLNVAAGNSQLVWSYQNDVAAQAMIWLQGKAKLEDVLQYADQKRETSIIEER